MTKFLAVDMGGTKISAALIEHEHIKERAQINTPSVQCEKAFIQALTELLLPLAADAELVAVASTGIINKGVLTALNPNNLGGLNQFALQRAITDITGLETHIINDAQAAAWAEFNALHKSYPNLAFITVSTGVGAGLVLNSQLVTGERGIAGHAGHTVIDLNGPLCGCGRYGCVEAIASGRAIAAAGRPYFGEHCTGKDVFSHYRKGSLEAEKIISHSAKAIAGLIANLTISLDLDAVSLGGSVGLAEGYLNQVQFFLAQFPQIYQPHLVPAVCQKDAGLIGAAQWISYLHHQNLSTQNKFTHVI